jgi:hypothetical protein
MAETKVKVTFYMGDEQDLLDYKGAQWAEALVGNPARKSEERDLEAGFEPSNIQINNVKLDLEAQTIYNNDNDNNNDNDTICTKNFYKLTKLLRVLRYLF